MRLLSPWIPKCCHDIVFDALIFWERNTRDHTFNLCEMEGVEIIYTIHFQQIEGTSALRFFEFWGSETQLKPVQRKMVTMKSRNFRCGWIQEFMSCYKEFIYLFFPISWLCFFLSSLFVFFPSLSALILFLGRLLLVINMDSAAQKERTTGKKTSFC